MQIEKGMVFTSRTGKRFAVVDYQKANPALGELGGWGFWSIDACVMLDGRYEPARLEGMVERGSLVVTEERFDVDAAAKEAAAPRFERAFGEEAKALKADATLAGERQIDRMLRDPRGGKR